VAERDGPRREVHGVHTPVDELEASFVGYVNGTSRLATAPRAAVLAEAAEALYSIPGSAKRTLGGIGANEGRETYATTGVMYKLIAPAVQH